MDFEGGQKLIKTNIELKIKVEAQLDLISTLRHTAYAFYSLINIIGPQNIL